MTVNFIATEPRCPGFTGPVIVGVVWKKQFLCGGDRNKGEGMECKGDDVNCSFIATNPRCPGFTGPVIVGIVWKKEFLCSGDRNEGEEMECKGNSGASGKNGEEEFGCSGEWEEGGEVEHKKGEVKGKKRKFKVWKKIWQWIMKKRN